MTFRSAVENLIANKRAAPMLEDLVKALDEERRRELQSRSQAQASYQQILRTAEARTGASREFVTECMNLLRQKTSGKIVMKDFLDGCQYLDEAARAITSERRV